MLLCPQCEGGRERETERDRERERDTERERAREIDVGRQEAMASRTSCKVLCGVVFAFANKRMEKIL